MVLAGIWGHDPKRFAFWVMSPYSSSRHAARQLTHMRERLEVIRAFLVLGWELRAVSHNSLADLSARLDELGKQATGWRQWFQKG